MRAFSQYFSLLVGVAVLLGACNLFYASGEDAIALDTGLEGTVLAGPQCPVQRDDQSCPDAPFAAHFDVLDAQERFVAGFDSQADGSFRVMLAPGAYRVVPGEAAPLLNPRAQAQAVTVQPDSMTQVTLVFDTGIR